MPSDVFKGDEGRRRLREALMIIIESQTREAEAEESSWNVGIGDDEIPGLADEMLDALTFVSEGVNFLALGPHYSVFETTLAVAGIEKWLAPAIVQDLSVPGSSPCEELFGRICP